MIHESATKLVHNTEHHECEHGVDDEHPWDKLGAESFQEGCVDVVSEYSGNEEDAKENDGQP